jgi:hypothetical protein
MYQPGASDAFYHKYLYDGDNRIVEVFTSRDDIVWESDARYFYTIMVRWLVSNLAIIMCKGWIMPIHFRAGSKGSIVQH